MIPAQPLSLHRHYRPALDGIRAVAVVAVIAYHTDIGLAGGFLGVDVFFVLSGYLITGLLLRERAERSAIDLVAFWAGRARRLLPAILLLVLVTVIVTARSVPSTELAARRDDLFSTLFYFSNWHLISSDQSYFAGFVGVSPLRHTWSLAIEEQFYIVWPLVVAGIMALFRWWRRALPVLIGVGIAGSAILMAVRFVALDPTDAYYATDTRVHQLLVGALLAVITSLHPATLRVSRRTATTVACASGALIATAFFVVGDRDDFYYRGGALLFAVVVAAGIWALQAGPRFRPALLLSLPPLVWIGRISYGVYLWHWPLIVWIGESPRLASWTQAERTVLEVVLTFAIAAVSYRWIECPIRYQRVDWLSRSGTRAAAVALCTTAVLAGLVVASTHLSASSLARQATDTSDSECPPGSPSGEGLYLFCARTQARGPDEPTVVVAGDSTSRALDPGMRTFAAKRGWRYVQAGVNACSFTSAFLVGATDEVYLAEKANCVTFVPILVDGVIRRFDPDVWIISDWNLQAQLATPEGEFLSPVDPRRIPILSASLRKLLETVTATGAEVVYLETPPTAEPLDCVEDRTDVCDSPAHSIANPSTRMINRIVRKAARGLAGVTFVEISDILCPADGRCPAVVDGALARYDGVHYTSAFSRTIVPVIVKRAVREGVEFAPS